MSDQVTVLFFASLREAVGHEQLSVPARDLNEVLARLADMLGREAISALRADNVRVAVNQTLVDGDNVLLNYGDEVAFLPPVTGG